MRRAFVPIAVSAAALLFAAPALAPAAPGSRLEPERRITDEAEDVSFRLHSEGFAVTVSTDDNGGGHQTATVTVERDGLTTYYTVPARVTEDSVHARFGSLGKLALHFGLKPGTKACRGRLVFTGHFAFTGEGGYVHVDADRADGVFPERVFTGCPQPGEITRFDEVAEGPQLAAIAGELGSNGVRYLTVTEYRQRRRHRDVVRINAFVGERDGEVRIARGAAVAARPPAFRRSLTAGTASLRPPAPFVGTATLTPGPGKSGVWEGSLSLPVLGAAEPVSFAGPDFRAQLTREEADRR